MNDLADQLRALVARRRDPDGAEIARTTRTNASPGGEFGSIARCARTLGPVPNGISWRDELPAGASIEQEADAIFVYQERLAIADDLCMATEVGTEAELVARREARRVAAGLPPALTASRQPDVFDAALAAFAPLGGLRLIDIAGRGAIRSIQIPPPVGLESRPVPPSVPPTTPVAGGTGGGGR